MSPPASLPALRTLGVGLWTEEGGGRVGLMEAGGVGRAGNPLTHIHTYILAMQQLVAGTCLSQGHTEGQPSEGWAELWLLLSRAKGLGFLGVEW